MEKPDKLKPVNKKRSTKWLGNFDERDQENKDQEFKMDDWYFDKPDKKDSTVQ